jgi:hypothetical protein
LASPQKLAADMAEQSDTGEVAHRKDKPYARKPLVRIKQPASDKPELVGSGTPRKVASMIAKRKERHSMLGERLRPVPKDMRRTATLAPRGGRRS